MPTPTTLASPHTMTAEKTAAIAKALAHPARVQIVRLLAAQTECRGADVFGELPLAQSTISEHLRILKSAGIVHATSVGTRSVYCLCPDALADLAAEVAQLLAAAPTCTDDGSHT